MREILYVMKYDTEGERWSRGREMGIYKGSRVPALPDQAGAKTGVYEGERH
jgi:hypothetical protein